MRKLNVIAPEIFDPGPFAHAVRVDNVVYTSSIAALDRDGRLVRPGDLAAQARQIYRNLGAILAAAGAGWSEVAKVNHFFAPPGPSAAEIAELRSIVAEHLPQGQQAGTDICFGLAHEGSRLQVEMIAHVGTEKRVLDGGSGHGETWAPGIRVGRHVYLGGRRAYRPGGADPATLGDQTNAIYTGFDALLKQAGIPWRDLVRVRQFITETSADFNLVREGRGSFVPTGRFTSTSVACLRQDPSGGGDDGGWVIAAEAEAASGTKISLNTNAMVDTPGVPHAVKVGDLVHLQAEISNDEQDEIVHPRDIEAQARRVMTFMDKMLSAAGCTWSDIVTSRIFCREREHLEIVRRIERHWAGDAAYARSDVVCRFFHAEALVEVELTAHCR
ncbi:RidA family protein [Rhodoligotrophos defluvii]|uniref:RidA family protein n=1 Tax=Rhodoligotrophos defluvii TaxID=2561934 RepID=UPI0010CA14AC|nr:Rid family hydrolase [Rhodoligotrophos defluvii]